LTTILRGTESDTLELEGTLLDGARVSLLFFAMSGLKLRGVPWPGFDYNEALWRTDARIEGEPAWLAVACDLDSALVRAFGRRIVRYPTRVARFTGRWSVENDAGVFSVRAIPAASSPDPMAARRTLVRDGGRVWEIPWQEIPAPERHVAKVEVLSDSLSEPTFGARVEWSSRGLVHRGRTHMCGIARRTSSDI
jgi:hypothetical protein